MLDPLIFEKPFIFLDSYSKRAKTFFLAKEKESETRINPSSLRKTAKVFVFIVVLFSFVTSSAGLYEYIRGDYNTLEKIRVGAVCNDGWISSATGSGACSWHGGVNHWLYKSVITGHHSSNHSLYFILASISFSLIFYTTLVSKYMRWLAIRNYFNIIILLAYVVFAVISFPLSILIMILYYFWRLLRLIFPQS